MWSNHMMCMGCDKNFFRCLVCNSSHNVVVMLSQRSVELFWTLLVLFNGVTSFHTCFAVWKHKKHLAGRDTSSNVVSTFFWLSFQKRRARKLVRWPSSSAAYNVGTDGLAKFLHFQKHKACRRWKLVRTLLRGPSWGIRAWKHDLIQQLAQLNW